MYRNKKDVDKHVENLMSKLSTKEFKTRAYSVARLYFEVGDYSSCKQYVEQYLTQKDNNAAAYKLLGQALQKLGQKEKALEQYKTSLDIDPTQTSTILDICELLADDEIVIDMGRAKYWFEKAEATFPRHPVTYKLRERLVTISNPDPAALVGLLTNELAVRPKDALLHARLIKHYLQSNQVKEATDHACNVEFSRNTFLNNYSWYETLIEIIKHNSYNINDWLNQLFLLTVRERICVLSLTETPSGLSKSLVESNDLLHAYDQAIEAVAKAGAIPGFAEFHSSLLQHHRGQLAFHAATYLLKKAKKDQLSWRHATNTASPLMLIAWHVAPLDPKVNWLSNSPEKQQQAVHRWYSEGAYRCSQSGHYLLANMKEKNQSILDQISQSCSGTHWRDKLYEKIFTGRGHLAKIKSSYLASDNFVAPTLRLPRRIEVETYDMEAQPQFANSLHHFVWTLLNYKNYAHFKCTLFDMLTPIASTCGPETLNKLDIHAFLYCAALTAGQQKSKEITYVSDKPMVLPANITDLLCTLLQMKWWDCAFKFSQNELGTELTDIRATISRGIEVVRCVDSHGLDPEMLCLLGRIFSEKAKLTTGVDEKTNFELRAGLYYSSAIPLLEKLKSKIVVKLPEKRMFDYSHKELTTKELITLINESKLFVALNHLNDCDYDKVIEFLSNVKTPQAYYYLSQTYKKIAVEENNTFKDVSETKSKCSALLSKAKNYAYKTIDLLKSTETSKDDPLYADTQLLIENIEMQINKIDPELSGNLGNDTDGKYLSDENISLAGSESIPLRTNSHVFRNLSSTPKQPPNPNVTNYRTAVDSHILESTRVDQPYLERIEQEIKNLQKRDTTINDFMEQTKMWFDENRKLGNQIISTIHSNIQNTTDQFKLLKISVDQVKDQIDECRNECKDVGDLKKQIAELKKEVNKLKKASSEQAIDESDLYNLDDDYRTNDSSSSFAPQLPLPQVIPPFNQRLVPPFSVPPNPYQLYGQNLYNLYNQYSQFAQAAQVPGAAPLFDPTRTTMNYPGLFPTPEQMYLDVTQLVPPSVPPPSVSTVPPIPPVPSMPSMPSISTVPPPAPAPVILSKQVETKETARALPVNVVITSSDPLPTCTTAPAPILSVTIPSKHIKGTTVHNYQIAMPSTNETKVTTPPIFSFPSNGNKQTNTTTSPFTTWNQSSMFKNSQSPAVSISNESMLSNTKSFGDGGLNNSTTVVDGVFTPNTSLNKSRTVSEKSNTSVENYDPCPDFKPIVPLPAEVKVTTGEEDESAIFSSRAKLFRFVDKQWKERGIGEIKLLKHTSTGKVRVLMRREQVHKICANHIITPEMEIKPMQNETKAYFWVAYDFADETVVLEKFCVRFKTADIANEFYEAFEKARSEALTSSSCDSGTKSEVSKTDTNQYETAAKEFAASTTPQPTKTVVGGFTFSSTPKFKPVENDKKEDSKSLEPVTSKANIFGGITFKTTNSSPFSAIFSASDNQTTSNSNNTISNEDSTKALNNSDTVEEFEPNVEFKPVIPLPALIEQKTGEEDENVLFEHRAKLLRFDAINKEWKERGLGNIKLLIHKGNVRQVRLLMRREQIKKVCCNHAVTKEMIFQKMPNMDKAVTWGARDFSENELVSELFCLRFKTAKICDDFMAAIKSAQLKMNDNPKAVKDEQNAAKQSSQIGFGDKFKPKLGSWYCETCYTNNLEDYHKCACCEQPKPISADEQKISSTSSSTTSSWGDSFKPKPGSWECTQCLIRNEAGVDTCNACYSPKDPSAPKASIKVSSDSTPKFMFGTPQQTASSVQSTESVPKEPGVAGWGDKFKAKEGSWECKECYVRNEGALDNCSACNNPKDPNAKKQEPKNLFGIATSGPKFTFGIPATTNNETTPQSQTTSIFDGTGAHKFSFGIPSTGQDKPPTVMSFGDTKSTTIFGTPKSTTENDQPVNFSLKKNDELVATKPALLPTPNTDPNTSALGKEGGTFDFVFKPKTPTKGKSPIKSPKNDKDEESDGNEYASEDEGHHIHFSPVIPMPDKVDVVTGEENETELYGHRAKLFRFTAGEWKERGIGVVKILKHNDTNKLRVVMRREQVHKICLNHALTPHITYSPKDDKTWLFIANDFSDGELSLHNFCLRFKTKEIALEFKEAIDRERGDKSSENSHSDIYKKDSSDDVVFVSEIQATTEEKEKAKELMLPENFFTYKNKTPCAGCRGCIEDEDNQCSSSCSTIISTVSEATTTMPLSAPAFNKTALTSMSTPTRSSTLAFQSPATSCYGTPTAFDKTADNSIFRTPLGSIGSNTKTTPTVQNNNASNSDATNKENTFIQKSIFSGLGEQKTLFATPPSKPTNIFGSSESQTPISTKTNILAAPKLSTLNTSSEEKQSIDPKSVFGFIKLADTEPKSSFGSNKSNDVEPKSIFGTNKSSEPEPKLIFGSIQQSSVEPKSVFGFTNTSTSVFGNSDLGTSLNKPILGISSDNKNGRNEKTEVKSLFGSDDQKSVNLFSSANQGGIFGPAALSNNQPGIFGSNATQTQPFSSGKSVFGLVGDPTAQWTGSSTEQKTSHGSPTTNGSGDKKKEASTEAPIESPFKVDTNLSFAALSSSNPGGFQKKDNFQWEGAGQQLFGVGQKSTNKELDKSKNDSGTGEEGATADEEYDPHYEPIVPLPDKIVVTTGEEDEEKLFGERCKLYRYDEETREWKERGVGEMKVLYHPGKNSYRLLLRREQVHKAVLNMLVFIDLELLPMKNSDRAWTWAGRNYAESAAGQQEMLAVRFKSVDLAAAFRDKVVECVRKLQAQAAQAIREEKESASGKAFETVAPLRLPKHMADSARADNAMSAVARASAATTAAQDTNTGDGATTVSEIFKQVHFREPEEVQEEEDEDDEEGYEDYDHNEDYDGYYNEDDEESSTYYSCDGEVVVKQGNNETVCPHGHVQVMYDQDIYSPKILVTDAATGETLADMLIHTDTEFQMSGDTCAWSGTDYTSNDPVHKTVTVNFPDSETALLFYDSCETSKAATTYTSTDPES